MGLSTPQYSDATVTQTPGVTRIGAPRGPAPNTTTSRTPAGVGRQFVRETTPPQPAPSCTTLGSIVLEPAETVSVVAGRRAAAASWTGRQNCSTSEPQSKGDEPRKLRSDRSRGLD